MSYIVKVVRVTQLCIENIMDHLWAHESTERTG